MLTRRAFLRLIGSVVSLGASTSAYAMVIEPWYRLRVTHYAFTPKSWPQDFPLRVAVVADLHSCDPWMDESRIANIVAMTNELGADCILLLGDYIATHRFQTPLKPAVWARQLAKLKAPLGVHSVLGNHDWWQDQKAMVRGYGFPAAGLALQDAGLPVYQNSGVRLLSNGRPFWLMGLGDQIAFVPTRGWRSAKYGMDDLPETLAAVTDDAPVLLMAHEPDVFPHVPDRVSLTVCGHTHGGQLNLLGWRPFNPSRYGNRFVYGHKIEEDRHVVISGGIGCSALPARIGSPPEIVLIDLGARAFA